MRVMAACIPSDEAGPVIRRLMDEEFVERHAKISKEGNYRIVPLLPEHVADVIAMGYEVIETEAHSLDRRSPQERIDEILENEGFEGVPPGKWEFVGDIVVVRLDPSCLEYKDLIGRTYASVLGAKTVCADVRGVSGEFRRPSMEVLFGTDTRSTRLENGIRYSFDVTKVMFASGNTDERMRMRELDCTGETVVDMFAGIGYFTLPIAKYASPKRLFACEKNPDSYEFLLDNIRINDVLEKVIPILGDNRHISGGNFADRILMGYVQTTSEFLPHALHLAKDGCTIHYHDTFYVNEYEDRIRKIFDGTGVRYEIDNIREVKSFAPSVSHYVADVTVRRRSHLLSRLHGGKQGVHQVPVLLGLCVREPLHERHQIIRELLLRLGQLDPRGLLAHGLDERGAEHPRVGILHAYPVGCPDEHVRPSGHVGLRHLVGGLRHRTGAFELGELGDDVGRELQVPGLLYGVLGFGARPVPHGLGGLRIRFVGYDRLPIGCPKGVEGL
ncbi:MAG: class I SAM-dependent methyltransferase family protein [Candidatus Methanomethylophilaceae archaeon]|nr:class I SAM-dependent methyltransferase family protein [Candidatus Methanomethylophilaceae archaeon]